MILIKLLKILAIVKAISKDNKRYYFFYHKKFLQYSQVSFSNSGFFIYKIFHWNYNKDKYTKEQSMKVTIIEKLESLPEEIKKTDRWKLAMAIAIDNGTAYFDDMYEAVDCYLHLGFTPEEICQQINFGTLNVEADEIKTLFDAQRSNQ